MTREADGVRTQVIRTEASGSSRAWQTPVLPLIVSVAALILGLLPAATPASADSAPQPPETVSTVTTDSLPTVQIDGVVWDQLIVGNTVYVTGSFNYARPAGAAPSQGRVRRAGALAYDIRTGELLGGWAPRLNGPGRALAVSTDGSRIFIGGDFSRVNGSSRRGIVAVHPTTGAVIGGFRTTANSRVSSLAVSGSTLYLGGNFTSVSGRSRQRLAAVRTSTGALLRWAPRANMYVTSVVVPRGVGNVVVAGRFSTLNGVRARGMGALDAATGQVRTWKVNRILQNYGSKSAITSLSTDGQGAGARVFGTAYNFYGPSPFEGSFRASAVDGTLTWVNGCRGDTYDAVPVGPVLYSVSHAHYCAMIGGQPKAKKKEDLAFIRAMATTTERDGINTRDAQKGRPAPRLLHWLPAVNAGTYTGQNQGAWTVEANADYVLLGGEFTQVNRRPQQGLARFAVRSKAPNTDGPQGYDELRPTVSTAAGGVAFVRWISGWDRDNRAVTHELLRGPDTATATVVQTLPVNANWWTRPYLGLTDTGMTPGGRYTYRVRVTDPLGNKLTSAPVTVTLPSWTTSSTAYRDAVASDGASSYWRLGEPGGRTGYDWQSTNDLALSGSVRRARSGAIAFDGDKSSFFRGTTAVHGVSRVRQRAPQTFTVEAWFKTKSRVGGKIVGFGDRRDSASKKYDRHLYLSNRGQVSFGVKRSGTRRITSAPGLNNNRWHHVVGTLGPQGMTLHVDGAQVGRLSSVTSAKNYWGYWRVGGDNLGSWPARGTSAYLKGRIDDVAVYPRALTPAQIARHAAFARNQAPTASFTAAPTGLSVAVDASASSDPEGAPLTYEWAFGDGTTGTGRTATHTYAAAGTYTITLTVTDAAGLKRSTTRSVTVTAPNQAPTASFTAAPTGLSVAVDASTSSDPEGAPLTYEWAFGDGTTGTGRTATHTYAAAGTYTITLTVTDAAGLRHSTTRSVTVTAPAPSAPAPTAPAPSASGATAPSVSQDTASSGTASTAEVSPGATAEVSPSEIAEVSPGALAEVSPSEIAEVSPGATEGVSPG